MNVSIGVYRHFKGDYYCVTGVSRNANDSEYEVMVVYFNVYHPEFGTFVRSADDFFSEVDSEGNPIEEREDNKTGQKCRFERVKDLDFQLGSVSTEQLIKELRGRKDNPLSELDIDSLSDNVVARDYVVGDLFEDVSDGSTGVSARVSFSSKERAENYLYSHKHRSTTKVYKRVFLEE